MCVLYYSSQTLHLLQQAGPSHWWLSLSRTLPTWLNLVLRYGLYVLGMLWTYCFDSDYTSDESFALVFLIYIVSYESVLEQEPYMEGVNPFIKNNKHRMIMFLDELGVSWNILCLLIKLSEVSYSSAKMVRCACRMSPTSLKPLSTLGRTCPGTWLRCMRSVPHTQTSCGH